MDKNNRIAIFNGIQKLNLLTLVNGFFFDDR
jgi:hypothetical protein